VIYCEVPGKRPQASLHTGDRCTHGLVDARDRYTLGTRVSRGGTDMKQQSMLDPVVEDVRKRGRAATARWHNDLEHIFEELRKRYEAGAARVVCQPRVVADPSATSA